MKPCSEPCARGLIRRTTRIRRGTTRRATITLLLGVLLLGVALLGPSVRPAIAQPIANLDTVAPVDQRPDPKLDGVVRLIRADLGLTGSLGTDRHGSITLWITSGAKAWSGTIIASFAEANGTEVRNYVNAATTPGRVTPVEVVVRLPSAVDTLTVSTGRRTLARLTQIPTGRELPLDTFPSGTAMIATLGDVSLARQSQGRMGLTLDDHVVASKSSQQATDIWANVRVAPIRRVPQAWIAYEQCDVVVTTSTTLESLGERGRAPFLDWVRSGGHMVVISDSSSREWALAGCADAIDLDEASSIDAPRLLKAAIIKDRTVAPIADYQIRTRLVRIRDAAWKPLWPIEDASISSLPQTQSLGAFGPVGLGTVTVFGGDPGRWTPVASNDSSIAIWRAIVTPSVDSIADIGSNPWGSGQRARSEASTRRWLLDRAFDASLPNPTLLSVLLMLLVIGLALALGPVDMLILRRLKLRHRSHRTAVAWLAGASIIAYATPLVIRSSDDSVARGTTTDLVILPDGNTLEAVTGATLVYAGSGTTVDLTGVADGAWCGVGSIEASYYSSGQSMILPAFNVLQTSTADGVRQGMNSGLSVGQWTFRIIEDIQPARPGSTTLRAARVERVGDEWRVTIDGLFPGDQLAITQCTLQVLGSPYGVDLKQDGDGRYVGYANIPSTPVGMGMYEDPYAISYGMYRTPGTDSSLYRLDLPLTSRRSRAFDAYADADTWSVVTLVIDRAGSSVRVDDPAFAASSLNVIRIAVPTPDATRIGLADETTTTAPASSPASPSSVPGSADESAFKHSALDPHSLTPTTPAPATPTPTTPAPTTSGNPAKDGE